MVPQLLGSCSAHQCCGPLPCSQAHPITSTLQIPLFSSNEEIISIKEIKNAFAFAFEVGVNLKALKEALRQHQDQLVSGEAGMGMRMEEGKNPLYHSGTAMLV